MTILRLHKGTLPLRHRNIISINRILGGGCSPLDTREKIKVGDQVLGLTVLLKKSVGASDASGAGEFAGGAGEFTGSAGGAGEFAINKSDRDTPMQSYIAFKWCEWCW